MAKVVKIYEVAKTSKESKIKGEKQLEDLTSSVESIRKTFDDYKEEIKKNDGWIKC